MTDTKDKEAKHNAEVFALTCEAILAVNALSNYLATQNDDRMYLANQALRPLWKIQDGEI